MLELIFRGFVEWIYGLVLETWEYFSSALLDIMSMDFAYLNTHIPILPQIMQIILAAGWALLIGNLVFQSLKSMMTGLGFEAEDPKLLFTRTFVFAFLLLASPQICKIGLNMTQTIINLLEIPDAVDITFAEEASFGGLAAAWLLVVICGVIVMFKVFRLLLEMAERYIILAMLTICAPLAFGVGGSRSTSDIFTGWCRMFASMCFLMVSHVIFFKMLLSVLSFVPSGLDVLPWMVLVFGIVKAAKKTDAIITRIGLNPAITGDGLGGRSLPGMLTYMVIRQAASSVIKSVGKSAGGAGRSAGAEPPSGGGPAGPSAGGAHFAGAMGGVGRQGQPGSQPQSAPAQPGGQPQSASVQGGVSGQSVQGEPQRTTAQQQTTATTMGGSVQQEQRTAAYQQNTSRQSAVPPGTRRAASHIRGMAGAGKPVVGSASGVGMRSGMAGTGTPNGARADAASTHRPGTAGIDVSGKPQAPQPGKPGDFRPGTAGTRFTSVQSVREGAQSGDVRATEQNHISAGTVVQEKTGPQSQGGTGRSGAMPEASRFTRREPERTRTSEAPKAASSIGSPAPPASPPVSPHAVSGQERPQPGESARHGRNPAASPARQPAGTQATGPARQERQRLSTGTAAPAKASASPPGTAGTAARKERSGQARLTAQRQAMRAPSTPVVGRPSGGGKAASTATARQEKGRSEAHQTSRKKDEGHGNGK